MKLLLPAFVAFQTSVVPGALASGALASGVHATRPSATCPASPDSKENWRRYWDKIDPLDSALLDSVSDVEAKAYAFRSWKPGAKGARERQAALRRALGHSTRQAQDAMKRIALVSPVPPSM